MMLDEMERSVHDSLCVVQRTLESNSVVPGGGKPKLANQKINERININFSLLNLGAVETALAVYLQSFARSLGSREQLAIAEFAEALKVIPKTLAVNAALDAGDLLSNLTFAHSASQTDKSKKNLAM